MVDQFIAEIRLFPYTYLPLGWARCDGQLLPISQNTPLFALLGTTYGGDGKSTFALPDLQGAAPLGAGDGPGLTERSLGEIGGASTVTLLESEIPVHSHTFGADAEAADRTAPSGSSLGRASGAKPYVATGGATTQLAFQALGTAGGDQPHNNLQPYLTLCFCIALQGIFPQRWPS